MTSSKTGWIYPVFIWHGFFLALTMSMLDFNTVLPSLIAELSHSKLIFGLLYSVILGAPGIFNLFFSHLLQKYPYKKRFLLLGIYLRSISFLGMAFFTYYFGVKSPVLTLISFFVWVFLFATSGGFAGLAYSDLIGEMVRKGERSKLYASREFASGIAAFLGSLIVAKIFSFGKLAFPLNYASLLLIGFFGLILASLGFWFIKVPTAEVRAESGESFLTLIKEVPQRLKADPDFLRFLIVENLTSFSLMILPFYMIYAKEILMADQSYIGRYLLLIVLGTISSNIFWGFVAKRKGSKMVVRNCILLGGIIPLIAIILTPLGPGIFGIVFLLVGFIQSGREVGFDPYLLDIAPEDHRTVYLGIRGTLNLLVVLLPILGGLFIDTIGYYLTFSLVTVIMFIALVILGLKNKRTTII